MGWEGGVLGGFAEDLHEILVAASPRNQVPMLVRIARHGLPALDFPPVITTSTFKIQNRCKE